MDSSLKFAPLRTLKSLFRHLPEELVVELPRDDNSVNTISPDSRQIHHGDLFVAITGGLVDGHRFIQDAVDRGAVAIVGEKNITGLPLPYFRVTDSRKALAYLSAAYWGFPARYLTVIGVTGTDGKTTTASLIYNILKQALGLKVGMISTVNAFVGDQVIDTGFHVTTPGAQEVQKLLTQMVDAGISHVILEATSHGLAQDRVTACEFDLGVITNITHEHLDFHQTYQAYRKAKAKLFRLINETKGKPFVPERGAVLNRDDDSYRFLSKIVKFSQLSYGMHVDADVRAKQINTHADGLSIEVIGRDIEGIKFQFPVYSNLVGSYNVANLLAAITLTRGVMLLPDADVQKGISSLEGIPGRMELIDLGQNFIAMVDFAHTPNALKNVLESARELTDGQVIAVFGSAGLRDREKRHLMAEISAKVADISVFTAEDPRTESLDHILEEMAVGAVSQGGIEGETFWRVADRGDALRIAIRLARPGDLVIACGKGHEQSMCFGDIEYPWDDRQAMRAALSELLGTHDAKMPYLPTSRKIS